MYFHWIKILCFACLFACSASWAQSGSISFHKLGIADGLHDGTARGIGQDKYGFIWIATVGALNRFDGRNVEHFTRIPGDTTSPYGSQPRCVHTDQQGRLWIGFETGLMEFDLEKRIFKRIPGVKDLFVSKIISFSDSLLFLATRKGLIRYNTFTGDTFYYANSRAPRHEALRGLPMTDLKYHRGKLFLATGRGLAVLDLAKDTASHIPIAALGESSIFTLDIDQKGFIWIGTHEEVKLLKLEPGLQKAVIYDHFLTSEVNTQPLNVMGILVDSKDRKWVVTAIDGLMEYKEAEDRFVKYLHNPNIPSSPSGNNYRSIFQDNKGMIWLGCDYLGVNYFEPDKFLFQTILPFPDRLDERARGVGRAITEDKQGNLWMGNHDGVTRYNPVTNTYTIWRNETGKKPMLYNNVVRAIHCDDENNIWIGTATGVNRFLSHSGQMEFVEEKKLPASFYNSITQDSSGNIWFCGNTGASLHWYNLAEKKYYAMYDHPQLKPYAFQTPTSYLLEDSKRRLWISWARRGVLMLDKKSGVVKNYLANDTLGKGIIGNQVVDIKEDRKGMIWITSFNGISGIDAEKDSFISFSNQNGLPGNWCASLAIDNHNRVWVGANGGLTMVSADRKKITRFSLADGLPSVGFPEHAAVTARNGDLLFPTYNGFIRFNPDNYREEAPNLNYYVGSYVLFDKQYDLTPPALEKPLHLKAEQNSFSFNLVALNYVNPHETWFAYKLEGFEKEWHYTQDQRAVYTNVPGGNYTFLYKAAVGNGPWDDVKSKSLSIHLDTLFFKTIWFWTLAGLLLLGGLFVLYRYRTGQERQLYQLRSQAQLLEKEKVMVMYDSLKQQLNPHFLFNSLTSLSGLIETDQEMAGEFLEQMSSIYRYILKNSSSDTVTLKDEIEFVQLYINLQKTRFGSGFEVTLQVPEEYLHNKIAPVTLQNLVENAIKHNIMDAGSPLVVSIYTEEDYLVVRNNLQKKKMVETSNKTGLEQFRSLYRYLTNNPVLIEETEKDFIIKVPLI